MPRKPIALSNWKMAMAIAEAEGFVEEFERLGSDLADQVDVVICPPYTALWAVGQAIEHHHSHLQLGAQDLAPSLDPARTGQISAELLVDVGCRWVMLGHWETRRYLGDTDQSINRKIHLALAAGLRPIVLVGESHDTQVSRDKALGHHLSAVLAGCQAEQVAGMVLVYEPEGAIGVSRPVTPDQAAAGSAFIRTWIAGRWGQTAAESVRLIYGGSVSPEHAAGLLAGPDIDGLGATRRGRTPATLIEIIRQLAGAR